MSDAISETSGGTLSAAELERLVEAARAEAGEDPFGNPILRIALSLTRRVDRGELHEANLGTLVQDLGRAAIEERAERLRAYVGHDGRSEDAFAALAERIAAKAGGFEAFRDLVERTRYAAVFTAHPTFGMRRRLALSIAALASDGKALPAETIDFRPDNAITLRDEFEQARYAVRNARDALDALNRALLLAGRRHWPERWRDLTPRPLVLASWVGCDTDGRTDIGWWDTLRYRLESKQGNYARILQRLPQEASAAELREIVTAALAAVEHQIALVPVGSSPSLDALQAYAQGIVHERETALTDGAPLVAALDRAIEDGEDDEARLALSLARAGCAAHGVSIALPHFRLNASQLHNALRGTVEIEGEPTRPVQRRAFLAAMNAALDRVEPIPIDFGGLAAERASAAKMLMAIAQILKHLDGSRPVRFLVAETETGYTLLAALWLARRFGIADKLEISPLFETAEALEQGPRIIDEALRSPHFRAYLKAQGRLCLQFGYSDSGRYIGQLAATFWIERVCLRIGEILAKHGLSDVELVLFDTHGESCGRGAHPGSLADRLAYLAPARSARVLDEAGIRVCRETSFQGTDGYLLFGTRSLAEATIARIAEHVFSDPGEGSDPIYDEPDFATEFFGTVRQDMEALVDDPGYAALIGTFGPSLLDKTGSRPAARQSDAGGPARIRHPRELRAIPNNAILQQLGWLANSIHGLGHAAFRAPDLFNAMREGSDRFARAWRLAEGALRSSDLDVMRAYLDTLDPGSWVDRARRTAREGRRDELLAVASVLERLDLAPSLRRLFGRFATDALRLREAAGEVPRMSARLAALHALRLATIHRIWFLAAHIPDFRPAGGETREALMERIIRLDVPGSLDVLDEVFPQRPDPTSGMDFGEPPMPRTGRTYEALHRDVFGPMGRAFALLRQISGAIQHEVGAFG
jgi:phosphoenolpyruvate carboxylase